ncbi:MAG: hypothetical protein ACK4L7_08145 [Flavobacteriales bacterium]
MPRRGLTGWPYGTATTWAPCRPRPSRSRAIPSPLIDLGDPALAAYGTEARRLAFGKALLWAGDVVSDGSVRYVGGANDRDPILLAVGGAVPTATAAGYRVEDVNLDGVVSYVGAGNDRDPVLVAIGGAVPTAERSAQLP